jgi:hypothetical protein
MGEFFTQVDLSKVRIVRGGQEFGNLRVRSAEDNIGYFIECIDDTRQRAFITLATYREILDGKEVKINI